MVESSDVVLEVLDARDPEGCRARSVEAAILAKDPTKKIVLVLNKIDLVPRDAVLKVSGGAAHRCASCQRCGSRCDTARVRALAVAGPPAA